MSFKMFLESLKEIALSGWAGSAYLVLLAAWIYYFRQRTIWLVDDRRRALRYLVAICLGSALLGLLISGLTLRRFSHLRTERFAAMKKVDEETNRLLDSWLGIEGSYDDTKTLSSLWITVHPVSPPYESSGIPQLVGKLHTNSFFKDCQAAKDIGAGYLVKEGAIQTVGDLYNFLNPCGEPKG